MQICEIDINCECVCGGDANKKNMITQRRQTGTTLDVCVCICYNGYSRGARTNKRTTENMTTSAKKKECCNKTRNKRQFHWTARVRLRVRGGEETAMGFACV